MTPLELCESLRGEPVRAAHMLVARWGQERADLVEPGVAWCDRFAAAVAAADPETIPWKAIFPLLDVATAQVEPLHTWVERASSRTYLVGARRWEDRFDGTLLSAVLAVWPVREMVSAYVDRLLAWAKPRAEHDHRDHRLAISLHDYPDLAYALADHAARHGESCWARHSPAMLAIERRAQHAANDERDVTALASVPPVLYVRETALALDVGRLLKGGGEPPAGVVGAVHSLLDGAVDADGAWVTALWLACGHPPSAERAIQELARRIEASPDPREVLELIAKSPLARHAFTGRGWGGDQLRRRLLPLTTVLLERRVLPLEILLPLVRRRCEPVEPEESLPLDAEERDLQRAHARWGEALGEALLQVARGEARALGERRRALETLARLGLSAGGSFNQALRKLDHPELVELARKVSHRTRDAARAGDADAELRLWDAWRHWATPPG